MKIKDVLIHFVVAFVVAFVINAVVVYLWNLIRFGDGAFNYNPVLAGLGICQEYRLPVLVIVLNNGGYMAMKGEQHHFYPEGWAATHKTYLGVDIAPEPDYAKMAEAFGGYGEILAEPGEIGPALNRALQQVVQGRVALLDVILDTP